MRVVLSYPEFADNKADNINRRNTQIFLSVIFLDVLAI